MEANRPKKIIQSSPSTKAQPKQSSSMGDALAQIKSSLNALDHLKDYNIRTLVKDAERFGPYLKRQRLETNQVRKFLDAINRLKAQLVDAAESADLAKQDTNDSGDLGDLEIEIVLLKPKLAYAAARQKAAKPLGEVIGLAIDIVHDREDFNRLVQMVESIIAYHKAEGGK